MRQQTRGPSDTSGGLDTLCKAHLVQVDQHRQSYLGTVEVVAVDDDAHCAAWCFVKRGRRMVLRSGIGGEPAMEVADRGPKATVVWATPHQELTA